MTTPVPKPRYPRKSFNRDDAVDGGLMAGSAVLELGIVGAGAAAALAAIARTASYRREKRNL